MQREIVARDNPTVEIFTRRASIPSAAKSWNPDERTLEVTVSTGAAVDRGAFIEKIALTQDWKALIGKPVLNSHRRGSLSDVLGHVVSVRADGRKVSAVIKLSRRPDVEQIVDDILAGHIRGISFGYTVSEWKDGTENGRRTRTITKLNPVEISLVPIPADPSATIRSSPMDPEEELALPPENENSGTENRAAINTEIRSIARVAGLNSTWIDQQVDREATVDEARAAAFEAMQTRSAPAAQVRNHEGHNTRTVDNPEVRTRAMGEALYLRIDPSAEVTEQARGYIGMTIPDLGRECLRSAGMSTTAMTPNTIVTRALHSTSDFPIILGDTVNRTMRASYQAAPSGLKMIARQTTLRDFRERKLIQTSQFSELEKVGEHGEFKRGTFEEDAEKISIATFGKVFGITRQALVNDDLGVFNDIGRKMGTAAAQFEANQLYQLLASAAYLGPTMSDGKTLFHADHGNVGSTAEEPQPDRLTEARKSMRAQTDKSGQIIAVSPKYLLVGPHWETYAEQVLTTLYAATIDEVNPFSGRLTLVVEPRFGANTSWYVVSDPAVLDGLLYAHLEGEEGPQIETRAGFDIDGMETRIRLDFGCAFADWRGWFRNAGS